jgi:hypothetical protein
VSTAKTSPPDPSYRGLETDENMAHQFAVHARSNARRLAWMAQEAIGCQEEAERMPRMAEEVRELLNYLERVVSLLKPHRDAFMNDKQIEELRALAEGRPAAPKEPNRVQ